MARRAAEFGYTIEPCAAGWAWTAFDTRGAVQERGEAPTKAIAAACVIRVIARQAAPAENSAKSKAA